MNSHEVFIHIHQGCFAGTGAIVRLPQCQRSKPDGYGKISQCITTTKHSKAKTVCIFLGIYCSRVFLTMNLDSNTTPRRLKAKYQRDWISVIPILPTIVVDVIFVANGYSCSLLTQLPTWVPHWRLVIVDYIIDVYQNRTIWYSFSPPITKTLYSSR